MRRSVELPRIRPFAVIAVCLAGLLVGGPWTAAVAAALSPLGLGLARSLRPLP